MILRRLVDERLVVAVILLNALALFLGGYEDGALQHRLWFMIDYACVLYFALEVGIKVSAGGWRAYWRNNWNRFDFVIVVSSAPVLLAPWLQFEWLSGITILRLLRLFRLFRLFRFIPNSDHLVAGVARALKASVGVFLGVLLVNVIAALGAVMLFGGGMDDPYFGTPLKACYLMFQVFTVEGWYEIPEHIAEHSSEVWGAIARLYFVLAVFGGGILGLSLVNAVFVDQMVLDNNDPLEERLGELTAEVHALRDELRMLRAELAGARPGAAGEAAADRPRPGQSHGALEHGRGTRGM